MIYDRCVSRATKRQLRIDRHRKAGHMHEMSILPDIPGGRARSAQQMRLLHVTHYCEGVLGGVTVNDTDTTRLPMPASLAVTRIVPAYVPAAIPVALAETTTEPDPCPAAGDAWSHEAPLVADHDTALGPEAITVTTCAGGFSRPSTATKFSPPGLTVNRVAAPVEDATPTNAVTSARQNADLRKDNAWVLMPNALRCRTGVSFYVYNSERPWVGQEVSRLANVER